MGGERTTRARWAAFGAVVAVTFGAGGLMSASATIESGTRSSYVPIAPCRVMDTRRAPLTVGNRAVALGSQETYSIRVLGTNGNCVIPADAVGLSLNVTAVSPTDNSYLTVFPADVVRPLASNLNWVVGASAVPNAVTVGVSVDGRISFFNNAGDVDVVADIVGYYADHTHDDRYYTESEIDTMLAAAVSHDHSHDDRYFTEAEVTAALDAKADAPPSATQVHIDSTEFQPASTAYAVDYLHEVANGRLLSGVHACFVAPLHLPNGALVTSLSVVGSDLNASPTDDFAVILYRNPAGATPGPTIMANVASSLSPGLVTLTDSSVMNAVADNTANSYFLRMCDYPNTYVSDITIAYTNP